MVVRRFCGGDLPRAMGAGLQSLVFMVCLRMAFSKHITPVEQPGETPPPA
jgi:hypothetical protein